LDGEHVIVAPLTDQASVVAYDAQTGKIAWQADPIPGALRYTSPVITEIGGVRQVVVLSNKATAGIDLRDGKILWTFTGWECKHSIPSPIMLPDGRIFLTGGYEAGSAMFRVTKGAEGFATEELYRISDIAAQIHQPIFHDGYLYLLGNSNKLTNGLVCLDLDGKVQWKTGENKFGRGNFILADGRFYIMDGKKGDLYLVKPSPTEYIELDSAPLLGGQNIWAPMALSDGRLYLRDQNEMKCIDVRQH
ncbi:PQQ-binding-like beta-propeller repeat protein, partial [bacterium]|nr:PQQ-binding-like beta-propeller repeat protein [bacterium]